VAYPQALSAPSTSHACIIHTGQKICTDLTLPI